MRFSKLSLSAICALFGGFLVYEASAFPRVAAMAYGPGFFPTLIGAGFLLCAGALAFQAISEIGREGFGWGRFVPEPGADRLAMPRFASVVLAILVFVFLSHALGFLLTVFLLCAALNRIFGVRALPNAAISLLLPLGLFLLFQQVLRVPLPRGILEPLLF